MPDFQAVLGEDDGERVHDPVTSPRKQDGFRAPGEDAVGGVAVCVEGGPSLSQEGLSGRVKVAGDLGRPVQPAHRAPYLVGDLAAGTREDRRPARLGGGQLDHPLRGIHGEDTPSRAEVAWHRAERPRPRVVRAVWRR